MRLVSELTQGEIGGTACTSELLETPRPTYIRSNL